MMFEEVMIPTGGDDQRSDDSAKGAVISVNILNFSGRGWGPDIGTFERHARGRVCLPCDRRGYSAEMTCVSGCADHVPVMSSFEWASMLTM